MITYIQTSDKITPIHSNKKETDSVPTWTTLKFPQLATSQHVRGRGFIIIFYMFLAF